MTGGGEAVLQLQHRPDLGDGWAAERDFRLQSGQAVWMEPGWTGRCRVAAGGQQWCGSHMTWQADQGEGVPVRKTWERPEGGIREETVQAHFTGAKLAPAPTTQGHRSQQVVYTSQGEMRLRAVKAIKMRLDEGAVRMANRT